MKNDPMVGDSSGAITVSTLVEAEKLNGVQFTAAQREELVAALPAQVHEIEALRRLSPSLPLQPAIHFDPRLPGVRYPRQKNVLRLSTSEVPDLPSDDAAVCFAPVTHLSHWIRTRQLSSTHLTELYLARISRIASRLYCYITVCADVARAQATAMDVELKSGKYRGPLHGVPYSLKDVFDTAGIPTTWGCALYKDRIPTQDAAIVCKLREAGAVLLGKVVSGELCWGWQWFGGDCRNPWNLEEPSGGSSAGSGAATAAGLDAFSIGTDALGSILNPADRCGIVGLRPTYGRVSVTGTFSTSPSLDRVGPLCRTVEDSAIVLAALNGYDPNSVGSIDAGFGYDASIDLRRLRVGYSPKWFEQIGVERRNECEVETAELTALEVLGDLGVTLVPIDLPDLPYSALLEILSLEAAATTFDELTSSGRLAELVNQGGWPPILRKAQFFPAVDYLKLERLRREVMRRMHYMFRDVDQVFSPTYGSFDLLLATNCTGQPGISLRAGFAATPARGMATTDFFKPVDRCGPTQLTPRGVTFHARLFEEGTMLALARELETRLNVWQRNPAID
jgi:Asp-tRNA(Asn)/Glu-tRNA(Gln) amidotransferase A subunit family amidase